MLTTGVLGRPTTCERSRRSTISVLIRRTDSGWSAESWVNAAVESRSRWVSRSTWTVAVRGRFVMSAISPTRSPRPISASWMLLAGSRRW